MPGQNPPATVITRREQPVTWVNGNKQIIPLSRNLYSRGLILHLTVQPTVTAANNKPANVQLGDEWAVAQKIEVYANSSTLLFSAAGSDLKNLNRILLGHRPRLQPNLGDFQTANPALDSTLFIPYLNPRSRRPFDTLLPCPEFTDYRLEITWAAEATPGTAIVTGATGYTANPNIEVFQRLQTAPVDGSGKIILPQFFRRMLKTPVSLTGAQSDFPKQLNTGPIYRGIIFNVQDGSGNETHTRLTNVKVENGATTYKDVTYLAEQQYASQLNDINEEQMVFSNETLLADAVIAPNGNVISDVGAAFSQATLNQNFANIFGALTRGAAQSSGAVNQFADPLSWLWMDFCEDGYMSEGIDTTAVGDTFAHFITNNTTLINMFTQELVRIKR